MHLDAVLGCKFTAQQKLTCREDALISKQVQGVQNVLGALLVVNFFQGTNNASTVQPVVDVERAVMYR